jgi:hypothetical protein
MTTANATTLFAETTFRNQHQVFGIRRTDRRYHMVLVGKTGMGKSTLLETLMRSDAEQGEGFALIDPHGDLAERVRTLIPEHRQTDVVYFDPADEEHRLSFNLLENQSGHAHLAVAGLLTVFQKIWAPMFWGPRMEYIFRNALFSLMSTEGTTLADVPRILLDLSFRRKILANVTDVQLKEFWSREFERYKPDFRQEAVSPILNKIGQFLTNPYTREILTQPKSAFNLRQIMDEGKIFIANLSKGRLGADASILLGSMLMTQCELAALSRADQPELARRDFYLYIDEFPTVVTAGFATVLSEARKYRLNLILAMQFVEQLVEDLRNALFENVGTLIAFRLGPESAQRVAREFRPVFDVTDLMTLPRYQVYLTLMVDGVPSQPFSARTLPPQTTGRSSPVRVSEPSGQTAAGNP